MTTLVVERSATADAEVLAYPDFDPLTAVFVAPQACSTLQCEPGHGVFCCTGYECVLRAGQQWGICDRI